MRQKLIDMYPIWKDKGLPGAGLCNSMPYGYKRILSLFRPTAKDLDILYMENKPSTYWGVGKRWDRIEGYREKERSLTPLREIIVLFICAIKDEI